MFRTNENWFSFSEYKINAPEAIASLYGSDSKESTCNTGDPGLIPGSGRFPGEGNGNLV